MSNPNLLERLKLGHPGWDIWDELITVVESLTFDYIDSEYLGKFFACGSRLCFSDVEAQFVWPTWLPAYVPALVGMKANRWEVEGGFAGNFTAKVVRAGHVFSPAGNDVDIGFPLIEVPDGVYAFQSNSSGARVFVNTAAEILYPDPVARCFASLDSIDEFARKNITKAVDGEDWSLAYPGLGRMLLD